MVGNCKGQLIEIDPDLAKYTERRAKEILNRRTGRNVEDCVEYKIFNFRQARFEEFCGSGEYILYDVLLVPKTRFFGIIPLGKKRVLEVTYLSEQDSVRKPALIDYEKHRLDHELRQ